MKLLYKSRGSHWHVRWFSNGALLGTLVFNDEEWLYLRHAMEKISHLIHFEEDE